MGPTLTHFWRINVDPAFETFDHTAGAPNTYDEEGYAAMGVDLDMACGQCHGGTAGTGATTNGAPYLSKANLAPYASIMHGGAVTGGPASPAPLADPALTADPVAGGTLSVGGTDCVVDTNTGLETCNIGVPTSVDFADGSSNGVATIWWGDGSGLESPPGVAHTYSNVGKYQVILTVRNAAGETTQKIFIVKATGAGSGKGTLAITGSAAPFSYSVSENLGDGTSITSGAVQLNQTKNIQLDGDSYDVEIGLRSGVVPGSAAGTCSTYPTTACYVDADCPMVGTTAATRVHDTCVGGAAPLACSAAVSGSTSGLCAAQVGSTITCTGISVTADNTVLTPATVTVTCP